MRDADGWERHLVSEGDVRYYYVRVRRNLGRAAATFATEWRLSMHTRRTMAKTELARGLASSYNEAIAIAGAIVRLVST